MLRVAARLGAEHGLEGMQMHDVAREAGVAIATLYRYFPSKTHLFAAVLHAQVTRLAGGAPPPAPGTGPVEAVSDLLTLCRQPLLALAMMQCNSATGTGEDSPARRTDEIIEDLVLRTAGVADPSALDRRVVRILEQAWYGLLTTVLYERSSIEEAEDGIRLACRLLLGPVLAERPSPHDAGAAAPAPSAPAHPAPSVAARPTRPGPVRPVSGSGALPVDAEA